MGCEEKRPKRVWQREQRSEETINLFPPANARLASLARIIALGSYTIIAGPHAESEAQHKSEIRSAQRWTMQYMRTARNAQDSELVCRSCVAFNMDSTPARRSNMIEGCDWFAYI